MSNKKNINNCSIGYRRLLSAGILLILLLMQSTATAQVVVQLRQPPPFMFKIENMWKVTLVNPTPITYKVYLSGIATESVKGKIVSGTSAIFNLPPGIKVVSARELIPMKVDVSNSKYSDVIQNNGAVPTGDYEICVSVINAETGIQLGIQCMQAQTNNMSKVELLQPENNTKFLTGAITGNNNDNIGDYKIIQGSFVSFSWLPPSPIPAGVKATYAIKIMEIYGNQSPYDAVLSNPAFYKNQNIGSNVFLYPVEGRKFNNNSHYAWKVEAYLNNVLISESETWEFTYTEKTQQNPFTALNEEVNPEEKSSLLYFKKHLVLASADDSHLLDMIYDNKKDNAIVPFVFAGNAKISFDAGYKALPFSDIQKNVITAELNPSMIIYELPFTANFLLSSQQGTERQSINSASFNIDFKSFRENMKARLEDKITELATGWEKVLMSINTLGIGTNYPTYTDYTLKGVPVTGINVEINPSLFYAAFAASKNQRGIDNIAYQRSLYAGRLGVGKKEGTHFFFTGLYATDDENSITVLPANLTLTPKANYVIGAETKLALFEDHILIEGEGNGAVLTRDTRDADLEIKAMPGWLKGMITPKISTSFDYSYAGKIAYNNSASATKVSFGVKMIGPGYTSLGAPGLRNDQLAYEAKFDQGFLGRKISIGTFFKTMHDNLIEWKSSTTTTTAYGINLGLNFPKLPFLQVSFSPYLQKNDITDTLQKIENTTTMISVVTGYALLIKDFTFLTNLSYSGNEAKTLNGLSDYKTNSISVSEAISFNKPFSFTGTWGLITTTTPYLNSDINTFDFGINATFSEFLTSTFGLNLASEKDRNKKTGIYLNTSITPLKNISFNARVEDVTYKNLADNSMDYNEIIFNLVLSASF